jgi:uncharacterized protein (DUF1778 family)
MGRPPKPTADKQDQLIMLRLTRCEKRAILRAARQANTPAATFVRQVALERARMHRFP